MTDLFFESELFHKGLRESQAPFPGGTKNVI